MNGWMCPQCGRAHGPHVSTCPEQAATSPTLPVIPPRYADLVGPHDPRHITVPAVPIYRPQTPYRGEETTAVPAWVGY